MIPVRVDNKGRLAIPRAERERLGIKPGDTLILQESDGMLICAKLQNPMAALAEEAIAEAARGQTMSLRSLAARHGINLDAESDDDLVIE